MAKKEIQVVFKIQAEAGKATPAPPVGPALSQHGLNPSMFCKAFNERTAKLGGKRVGCVITVYKDKSYEFLVLQPPASVLIRDKAGIEKGSSVPNKDKVGKLTWAQCLEIAKDKSKEMTGLSLEACARTLAGTARSMGVTVEGVPAKK